MPVRPQVAINWCMRQGTVPIPGAKTLQQAEDNLGALGWRLTDGEARPSPLPAAAAPASQAARFASTLWLS